MKVVMMRLARAQSSDGHGRGAQAGQQREEEKLAR
jgi:hypothetical protein